MWDRKHVFSRTPVSNPALIRMICNSRTSFVLENISVDENPNIQFGFSEVPGSDINRDHRPTQVRIQHLQASPGKTFLVLFPYICQQQRAFSHITK